MQLNDLKTSLFGFNKNDVCEYISQLNTVYEEKERQIRQEHREIVDALNQKNENMNNNVAALGQENTDLARENDALKKRIALLDGKIGELRLNVGEIRNSVASVFENVTNQLDLFENQIERLMTEQSGEKEDER